MATDAIGWLRSQDGQQNKELQQEKRSWLMRFNNDRCKRPMAPSKNCQAESDARRKAFCNALATNIFFITSRKNMSRKTCGSSSWEDLHQVSKQYNKCKTQFIARALTSQAGCKFDRTCKQSVSKQTDNCIYLRLVNSVLCLFATVPAHTPSRRLRQAWCRSGCFDSDAERQSTLARKTAVMWHSVSRHLQ